ncbi:MAG: WYL domain-containing protein [Limnochordaceae bacterium]|nr:WYL domain-containing protein [Limnochordaceae bacterium]
MPRTFDLAAWVKGLFDYEQRAEERLPIEVHFSPQAGRRVVDDRFFREGLERQADGSFKATLTIPVSDLDWYAEIVVGYAGQARVVSPPVLRERVAMLARGLLEVHEAPASAGGGDTSSTPPSP